MYKNIYLFRFSRAHTHPAPVARGVSLTPAHVPRGVTANPHVAMVELLVVPMPSVLS